MRFFKPNVDKMLKQKDIVSLVKTLEDDNDEIVTATIQALDQIGGISGIDLIVERLNDRSPFRSEKNVLLMDQLKRFSNALAACSGNQYISALAELVKTNPFIDVQHCCIHALGELKSAKAIIQLMTMSPTSDAQFCCVEALRNLRDGEAVDALCDLASRLVTEKSPKEPRTSQLDAISKTTDEALAGLIALTLKELGVTGPKVEATLLSILDEYPYYEGAGNVGLYFSFDAEEAAKRQPVTAQGDEHYGGWDPFEEAVEALSLLGGVSARDRLRNELTSHTSSQKIVGTTMYTSERQSIEQECRDKIQQALQQIEARVGDEVLQPKELEKETPKITPEQTSVLNAYLSGKMANPQNIQTTPQAGETKMSNEEAILQYLKQLGASTTPFNSFPNMPTTRGAIVTYMGLQIDLQILNDQVLIVQFTIGVLPQMNAEALLRQLMVMNSLMIGIYFCVFNSNNSIVLRTSRAIEGLDFVEFKQLLNTICNAYMQNAKQIVQTYQISPQAR